MLVTFVKEELTIMNARLQQFLAAENISQSQFADSIGVARASVSHIISGRNKPGFDFIEGMSRRFPTLNLEWLITGKGKMYKDGSHASASGLFTPEYDLPEEEPAALPSSEIPFSEAKPQTPQAPSVQEERPSFTYRDTLGKVKQQSDSQRSISKIIVFYDDNTFQELK